MLNIKHIMRNSSIDIGIGRITCIWNMAHNDNGNVKARDLPVETNIKISI